MSKITKLVDRGVPINQRVQIFTQADASVDDIIMVRDSLGKSAKDVTIESVSGLSFRVNVLRKVYKPRTDSFSIWQPGIMMASGVEYQDDSGPVFELGVDETYEFSNDIPIEDIELVTVSGNFTITVL